MNVNADGNGGNGNPGGGLDLLERANDRKLQQQQQQQHQHRQHQQGASYNPSNLVTGPQDRLLPISRPSSSGSGSGSGSQYSVHSLYQQGQNPLDEAFRPTNIANATIYGHHQHNNIINSNNNDIQSLYHLPSHPFDSFDTIAGLKASPVAEKENAIGNGRDLNPGQAAREISKRTEEAFARGGSVHSSSHNLQPKQNDYAAAMLLNQNSGMGAIGLDPSMPSFEPLSVQPRKNSFGIPIASPLGEKDIDGAAVGGGGGGLSPLTSRNGSISSEGSGLSMDPESAGEEEDVGMGKERKGAVYRSPARKPLAPIDIERAAGQQTQSVVTPNTPGTPPHQSAFAVPSIQTTAATPMKARHSPSATGHRRNDSFVDSTDPNDDLATDVSSNNDSPRRTGRLSLGGSSNSLRQGFVGLGRKSSMATINEDKDRNDKKTLWFGDLEPWMDDNYMRSVCTMMGWEVDNIKLIRPSLSGGGPGVAPTMNAGYCFITFYTPEEALRVLTIITPSATNAPVPMPNATRNFRANWASGATVANPFKAPTELPPTDGKEYSVFVGDLAPAVTEEILIQTFMEPPRLADGVQIEGFAGVRGAKIMTDPVTGMSKMYGFVRFSNEAEQQRALVEMQGVPCLARGMRISPATTRARTPSGAVEPLPTNIARSVTPDYLLQGKDNSSGAPPLTSAHATMQRAPSPTPAGMTIQQPTPVSAVPAVLNPFSGAFTAANPAGLTPGDIAVAADPALAANLAQIKLLAATPSMPNPNGPPVHHSVAFNDPTNTTVFVGGLSPVITEDMLRAFFAPFGEISKVTVPLGKKCGFVHFGTKADAERSIEKLQGFPLAGSQLRLSWGKSSTAPKAQQSMAPVQQAPSSISSIPPNAQVNPLQAQILQMQQQLAALTAMANQQSAAGGMVNGMQAVPGLLPSSASSFSPISPLSTGPDPFASLALSDPQYFTRLLATNPSSFSGALGNGLQRSSYSAPMPTMNGNLMAQLQANQQQMLQLQALQAQLEDSPNLGTFSPFSPNPAAEAALRQKEPAQEQNQFWQGQKPRDLPTPRRSISPFSQAAQAMAERASERNSGRSRHSTSPGENVAYLSANGQGTADNRRQSSSARYSAPGQGSSMRDVLNQARSRTKSESVQQAFAGLSLGANVHNGASWINGPTRTVSCSDAASRANSESPQSARRTSGGSFGGA